MAQSTGQSPANIAQHLRGLDFPPRSFDLTYAYQVFEHLSEPRCTLHHLLHLTRPGGLVVIHTDMEVPEREAGLGQWWYVMPPHHCCFFRHRTFEAALAGTGHRIVHRSPKMVAIALA